MTKKTTKDETTKEVEFGEVISSSAIPMRGASHRFDVVIERAQNLGRGQALPFQAPSTSSLARLKKRLAMQGYKLTTRTNPDGNGVTAYVENITGTDN